jgi:hypothetical protein
MRSSVETIETAPARPQQATADRQQQTAADTNTLQALQAAIEELIAVLQRLSAAPEGSEQVLSRPILFPLAAEFPLTPRRGVTQASAEIDAGC